MSPLILFTAATAAPTAYNGASGRLRSALLASYDKGVFPWEVAWEAAQADGPERSGLEVEMGINFHRVHSVDVVNHATDMIVWYRLRWHDPRLVWNASQYGGLTTLQLWVGDGTGAGETSEIWTPDMTLWNQGESMQTSLSSAFASVSSDGTVFWSRPGHLRPTCKFVGLDSFPFDELGCTMEFGSWSFRPDRGALERRDTAIASRCGCVNSGLYLRPVKMDAGFSIGGSETAGESFQEFSLERVSCRENVYPPYPGDPENDWPVLLYEVCCTHAHRYARSGKPTLGYSRHSADGQGQRLGTRVLSHLLARCSLACPIRRSSSSELGSRTPVATSYCRPSNTTRPRASDPLHPASSPLPLPLSRSSDSSSCRRWC